LSEHSLHSAEKSLSGIYFDSQADPMLLHTFTRLYCKSVEHSLNAGFGPDDTPGTALLCSKSSPTN
jgi:hypothetical protein